MQATLLHLSLWQGQWQYTTFMNILILLDYENLEFVRLQHPSYFLPSHHPRFRSAMDAEKLAKEAVAKGETLPSEDRFDSNCITPGGLCFFEMQQKRIICNHKLFPQTTV